MSETVSIRGTREGLTITLGAGDYDALFDELNEHLKLQGAFFRGGRVALQVGDRQMQPEQLSSLSELLEQFEVTLRTVVTSNVETQRAVQSLGLRLLETNDAEPTADVPPTREAPTPVATAAKPAAPTSVAPARPARQPEVPVAPAPAATDEADSQAESPFGPRRSAPAGPAREAERSAANAFQPILRAGALQEGSRGTLVRRLVRSGQVVRHPGHIVVIGDVNVGAEIIAGGDIIVWGRLYGTAHAGSMGDDNALVCALEFAPLQLRIGSYVARPGEDASSGKRAPEVASVRDGAIVVQPWDKLTRFGG
jgi:septum site-determining protein MinC